MIKLLDLNGLLCPIVECDRCRQPIVDASRGAVVWTWETLGPDGLEFRHKGPCFPMSERRPWRELREFMDQLRNNVESDPRTDPVVTDR